MRQAWPLVRQEVEARQEAAACQEVVARVEVQEVESRQGLEGVGLLRESHSHNLSSMHSDPVS